MNKSALRKAFQAHLVTLHPAATEAAADRVADRLLDLPEIVGARGVLACLSFGAELDTWRLMSRLKHAGKQIYVPRVERQNHQLHVHPYPCPLESLSFGLRQPTAAAPAVRRDRIVETIDVVLILGLAFDHDGYRLGHGGGYFDRFLATVPITAIGLAHDCQRVAALPREDHDIPMDVVVTDRGVWRA